VQLFPERDCRTCSTQNKREWGCEKDGLTPFIFGGEYITRCPRRPILDNPHLYAELFEKYHHYKNGLYPDSGGSEDQAYKVMYFFREIDRTIVECDDLRRGKS